MGLFSSASRSKNSSDDSILDFMDYYMNKDRNELWVRSRNLEGLTDAELAKYTEKLKKSIIDGLNYASQNWEMVQKIAMLITDGLYRSINTITVIDGSYIKYTEIVVGTAMKWFFDHGLQVHYLCNNTFSGYIRPLIAFPAVYYGNTGIQYICPHEIAWQLMQDDGIEYENFEENLPKYLERAKDFSKYLIDNCNEKGFHYFDLEIDRPIGELKDTLKYAQAPGHFIVIRTEDPALTGKVDVIYSPKK